MAAHIAAHVAALSCSAAASAIQQHCGSKECDRANGVGSDTISGGMAAHVSSILWLSGEVPAVAHCLGNVPAGCGVGSEFAQERDSTPTAG